MIITSYLAHSTLISISDFPGNKRFDRATGKNWDDPKLTSHESTQKIYQENIIDQILNDEILSNCMYSLWIQTVILLGSASFQQKSLSLLLCVWTIIKKKLCRSSFRAVWWRSHTIASLKKLHYLRKTRGRVSNTSWRWSDDDEIKTEILSSQILKSICDTGFLFSTTTHNTTVKIERRCGTSP